MNDENCIFCKIVAGEIPSKKIFENDKLLAFLDIQPLSMGHFLVIPKIHAERLHQIPDNILSEILPTMKKLALKLGIIDYNILQNNGSIAHQAVFHAHFHLIPKTSETGLDISWKPIHVSEEHFNDIEGRLK